MKVLHLDKNDAILIEQLRQLGFENEEDYTSSKQEIEKKMERYDGLIIRSRFPIDRSFLDAAKKIKFIGRVGAGLENIDCEYAKSKGIALFSAPEGNLTAVAEHTMGLLLGLMNKLRTAHEEIQQGKWRREENRGIEVAGRTVGIIGYGNMGKAFAKRLQGFECRVIFYDIQSNLSDANAQQVSLEKLQQEADILSLHIPETPLTIGMIDKAFFDACAKPIVLINTARGKVVKTKDLVEALDCRKVIAAGLDVLEYEKSSFEQLFTSEMPKEFEYLIRSPYVLLSPHVAGWTFESKEKLARVIADKITKWYQQHEC